MGYDLYRKRYRGIWVDLGSPALYYTGGLFDESGKVYKETSDGPPPARLDLHAFSIS